MTQSNLTEQDIHTSIIFSKLPRFNSISFKGYLADKIQHFEAERDGETCRVIATSVIRKSEKFFWESCQDLLARSVKHAEPFVKGVYQFDLLCFDVHREIDSFNDREFGQLLANHAHKLRIGDQQLVKYSSAFCFLKRLSIEDWGKMVMKSNVQIYDKEPSQLDLLVKKLIQTSGGLDGHRMIVIHDLSQEPIFNPDDAEQSGRLAKHLGGQFDLFSDSPEIFVNDKTRWVELIEKFVKR